MERCYGTLKNLESDNQENADQVSLRERDYLILQQENDTLQKENDNLKSQLRDAGEREKRLFDLTDRLMLQPPPAPPKKPLFSFLRLFRNTDTETEKNEQGVL